MQQQGTFSGWGNNEETVGKKRKRTAWKGSMAQFLYTKGVAATRSTYDDHAVWWPLLHTCLVLQSLPTSSTSYSASMAASRSMWISVQLKTNLKHPTHSATQCLTIFKLLSHHTCTQVTAVPTPVQWQPLWQSFLRAAHIHQTVWPVNAWLCWWPVPGFTKRHHPSWDTLMAIGGVH